MRRIYLVRHGETAAAGGPRRCIGYTDVELNVRGLRHAARLGRWFALHPVTAVFSSPLIRCRETAQAIGLRRPPQIRPELIELSAGEWENLTFEEIRRRWPERYEERGRDLGRIAPPQGESFAEGGLRLKAALEQILRETEGDVAVITHSGVSRGLLCGLLGWELRRVMEVPQPFGGLSCLEAEENGELSASFERVGVCPQRFPGLSFCRALSDRRALPSSVRAHELAVARLAGRWANALMRRGPGDTSPPLTVSPDLTRAAALLHDIARLEENHAAAGAKLLRAEGYPELARIIAWHHGLPEGRERCLDEALLVFLADKLLKGDRPVSLKERFAASEAKCRTEQARKNHERQRRQASAAWETLRAVLSPQELGLTLH